MREKPALAFWQIWNMCFGFLGIQFGFALQNANVSRIFQTLGASIDDVAGAVARGARDGPARAAGHRLHQRPHLGPARAAPAVFPRWRHPATLVLLVMPNSPGCGWRRGLLWMLDASINITMEPFRALVGDMLPDRAARLRLRAAEPFHRRRRGGRHRPCRGCSRTGAASATSPAGGDCRTRCKWAFYIGAVVLHRGGRLDGVPHEGVSARADLREFSEADVVQKADSRREPQRPAMPRIGNALASRRQHASASRSRCSTGTCSCMCSGSAAAAFGVLQLIVAWLQSWGRTKDALYASWTTCSDMPRTMRQLALVQFLSWFGLFAMWIYTTSAVTSRHYGATDPPPRLQRGRELGRRAVRGLQRLRCARRDPDPARRREDRAPPRAPREPGARRRRADLDSSSSTTRACCWSR